MKAVAALPAVTEDLAVLESAIACSPRARTRRCPALPASSSAGRTAGRLRCGTTRPVVDAGAVTEHGDTLALLRQTGVAPHMGVAPVARQRISPQHSTHTSKMPSSQLSATPFQGEGPLVEFPGVDQAGGTAGERRGPRKHPVAGARRPPRIRRTPGPPRVRRPLEAVRHPYGARETLHAPFPVTSRSTHGIFLRPSLEGKVRLDSDMPHQRKFLIHPLAFR